MTHKLKELLNLLVIFPQEIRTVIRDLEQSAREILAVLQAVHQTPNGEGWFGSFSIMIYTANKSTVACIRYFFFCQEKV